MNAAIQRALREASLDLEALRPQIAAAIGGKEEDKPIVAAWDLALRRYREACAAYAFADEK